MKRLRLTLVLLALVVSAILTNPASALAQGPGPENALVSYVVGNDADTAGLDCATSGNCTLRSALQLAHANGGNTSISFTPVDHVITLTSLLPLIEDPDIRVNGNWDQVRVNANNMGQAFRISGDRAVLSNLIIHGSITGTANIWIMGAAVGVEIMSNVIGPTSLSDTSCDGSPYSHSGIYVSSTGGSIPTGTNRAYIYGNHIGFNCGTPGDGVYLASTDHVLLGVSPGGLSNPLQKNALYHNHNGITIQGGSYNTIRNTTLQFNSNSGVYVNGSTGNEIRGIDTWRNENTGIELVNGSVGNKVGCDKGGPWSLDNTNYVVGNLREGIYIDGVATTQNSLGCNSVGIANFGDAQGNSLNGVVLTNGAHHNVIGGSDLERNVISASGNDGVKIEGGAHNNEIQGNYIGLSITGTMGFGNAASGVSLSGGAYNNLVGGDFITTGNKIGGNGVYGVYIGGANTTGNSLRNNHIGFLITGSPPLARPNGSDGITLQFGAHGNLIGPYNTVQQNLGSGLYVVDSPSNVIDRNFLDLNSHYGVILAGTATSGTALSNLVLQYNGADGLGERQGAANNTWSNIVTRYNSGMGIDKYAESDATNTPNMPFPTITSVDSATGAVRGAASATLAPFFGATVELYNAAVGYSSFVQAKRYISSASTDSSGNWIITDTLMAIYGTCYVALETDAGIGLFGAYSYSSELGPSNCGVFLPLVLRN